MVSAKRKWCHLGRTDKRAQSTADAQPPVGVANRPQSTFASPYAIQHWRFIASRLHCHRALNVSMGEDREVTTVSWWGQGRKKAGQGEGRAGLAEFSSAGSWSPYGTFWSSMDMFDSAPALKFLQNWLAPLWDYSTYLGEGHKSSLHPETPVACSALNILAAILAM